MFDNKHKYVRLEVDKLNEVIGRLRNLKIELKDKVANGVLKNVL